MLCMVKTGYYLPQFFNLISQQTNELLPLCQYCSPTLRHKRKKVFDYGS